MPWVTVSVIVVVCGLVKPHLSCRSGLVPIAPHLGLPVSRASQSREYYNDEYYREDYGEWQESEWSEYDYGTDGAWEQVDEHDNSSTIGHVAYPGKR